MSAFVGFVFSQGGCVVAVLLAALWVAIRPQTKAARRSLVVVAVFYTMASVYAVGFLFTRPLVAGYRALTAAEVPGGSLALVVLGSGSYSIWDWSGNELSTTNVDASSRVLEAVRVYKLANPEWVISSGGKVHDDDVDEATGETMAGLLRQLGVPAGRIVVQTKSRNTHEEAGLDLEIIRRLKVERVILVTSDFHMRRSVGAFRAAGVEVTPAIARDPFPAREWQDWVVPGDEGLRRSSALAHEVLGIAYYALRGWYRF
jgi:uncharacterized SAM-binding protein YcdF (DUF218 family)